MVFRTRDALDAMYGKANCRIENEKITIWREEFEQPTEEAIQAQLKELQAEYDSQSYARARESQYPSITDVIVALAEKEEGNDAMWQEVTALRQKVKSDNPKPT